ncbi:MAG: T9SS type A sorting domain-containing protein [Bacteroidales bacterium]
MKRITYLLIILLYGSSLYSQNSTPWGNLLFCDSLKLRPLNNCISINTTQTNIWKIGTPSKNSFNSSHSGKTPIITDTLHTYSTGLNDYFSITINLNTENYFIPEGILSFYHKFDTDTLIDGGIIEISYDNGNTWTNIINDNNAPYHNYIGIYSDTIHGNEYGFSGNSNGWKYVELHWAWYVLTKKVNAESDPRIIRFRFKSDNINTNKDGWMIDDIVFRGYDVSGSVNDKLVNPTVIYPNPTSGIIHFTNDIVNSKCSSIEFYNINGKLLFIKNINNSEADISDQPNGVYIYKVNIDNRQTLTGKIIKQGVKAN